MSEPGASELECRQIAELLGDYIEGSLPKSVVEMLEWHIDGCASCVAFLNTYRRTVAATGRLPEVALPPELKERLRVFLRSRSASNRQPGA